MTGRVVGTSALVPWQSSCVNRRLGRRAFALACDLVVSGTVCDPDARFVYVRAPKIAARTELAIPWRTVASDRDAHVNRSLPCIDSGRAAEPANRRALVMNSRPLSPA